MDYKKEIIERLNGLSGSRSLYEVFCDWVKCCAIAIQNACQIGGDLRCKREEQYLQTIKSYGEQGVVFGDIMALLVMALNDNIEDVLGQVYMEAGLGNKSTGQFFTPFHISLMCAELVTGKNDENEKITLNEPSCGAGGMIIAVAESLRRRGINFQTRLDVVAQDLDWKAVYMCYIQLCLLGICATVVQGDTLSNAYIPGKVNPECVFYTPRKMGVLV